MRRQGISNLSEAPRIALRLFLVSQGMTASRCTVTHLGRAYLRMERAVYDAQLA